MPEVYMCSLTSVSIEFLQRDSTTNTPSGIWLWNLCSRCYKRYAALENKLQLILCAPFLEGKTVLVFTIELVDIRKTSPVTKNNTEPDVQAPKTSENKQEL